MYAAKFLAYSPCVAYPLSLGWEHVFCSPFCLSKIRDLFFHNILLDERCVDGITILEGLAASGLRSVRYALEVPGVRTITANDISADAYRMMQKNIEHNNVKDIVEPSKEDAGWV